MTIINAKGYRVVQGSLTAAQQSQVVIQFQPFDYWSLFSIACLDPAISGRSFSAYLEYGVFPNAVVPAGQEFAEIATGADLVLANRFPVLAATATNRLQTGPSYWHGLPTLQPFFVWFWDNVALATRPVTLNYSLQVYRSAI